MGEEIAAVGHALYTFKGESEKELSFEKGQEIRIVSMDPAKSWWEGIIKTASGEDVRGFFSKNYVQVDQHGDQHANQPTNSANSAPAMVNAILTSSEVKTGVRVGSTGSSPASPAGKNNKQPHILGPPQPGQYPWSKTFVCSCGARLPSPEVANIHIKNFNK
eukprot:TRINITY_DN25471_c0_g1_i1.p1 TRINITY_DN25471_c0_g1~~TRINITY_DN25471_c0_g1_i1.p1  ORF type:complete len:162 (-),score=20.15 TRINITY_DN25471_c0_g1_i1:107-592(-)